MKGENVTNKSGHILTQVYDIQFVPLYAILVQIMGHNMETMSSKVFLGFSLNEFKILCNIGLTGGCNPCDQKKETFCIGCLKSRGTNLTQGVHTPAYPCTPPQIHLRSLYSGELNLSCNI